MNYIFPPRPALSIPVGRLRDYEKRGYVAQRKFNGTRNVIYIPLSRKCYSMGRHGGPHKSYSLTPSQQKSILGLNLDRDKEYVFDSELMHHKTKGLKDTIVLYDVLFAGKYLFKETQSERFGILNNVCGKIDKLEPEGRALEITNCLWLAECFTGDFEGHFKEAYELDGIEGLVLRRLNGALKNYGIKLYETSDLIRCRMPTKTGVYF